MFFSISYLVLKRRLFISNTALALVLKPFQMQSVSIQTQLISLQVQLSTNAYTTYYCIRGGRKASAGPPPPSPSPSPSPPPLPSLLLDRHSYFTLPATSVVDPDPFWIRIQELPDPHMQIQDKMEANDVRFKILINTSETQLN